MSRQSVVMPPSSPHGTNPTRQPRSPTSSKNASRMMLQGDCESVNGSGQRYRASEFSKSAMISRESANDSGGRGNSSTADSSTGASTSDGNGDDDDDSSDEIEEGNEEESEAIAPSGELNGRKGKKRNVSVQPKIVVENAPDMMDAIETGRVHQTGLNSSVFSPRKPVTRSSVLREGDEDMKNNGLETDYPRKKPMRRISNNSGFLAYGDVGAGGGREENIRALNGDMGTTGSSDDESYKGVDLISDSEEDEPGVEEAEAKVIIDSEEESDCLFRTGLSINRSGTALSGRLSDWGDFDVEDGLLLDDVPLFNQQYTHVDH